MESYGIGSGTYTAPATAEQKPTRLSTVIKQLEESFAHLQQQGNALRRIADRLTGPIPEGISKDAEPTGGGSLAGFLETIAAQIAKQAHANDQAIERIESL